MTQEFDSAALVLINAQYGLSGVDAEQQTFLDDGNVSQVIQAKDSARRARAPFSRGIFHGRLENVHTVAGDLESFVDPYNPVNVHNRYPAIVDPQKFEIWLLGATVVTNVGGNVTFAFLGMNLIALLQGVSDTAAGGPAATTDRRVNLFTWDDFAISDSLEVEYGRNVANGEMQAQPRRRLAPGESILLRSQVTAAASLTCMLTFFIGPVALGQDLF